MLDTVTPRTFSVGIIPESESVFHNYKDVLLAVSFTLEWKVRDLIRLVHANIN